MPLKSVNETKIEAIDYNKEKYFLLVEGYSLLSNIGFGTSKGVIYYSIRKTCNSKIYSKMRYMKKKLIHLYTKIIIQKYPLKEQVLRINRKQ